MTGYMVFKRGGSRGGEAGWKTSRIREKGTRRLVPGECWPPPREMVRRREKNVIRGVYGVGRKERKGVQYEFNMPVEDEKPWAIWRVRRRAWRRVWHVQCAHSARTVASWFRDGRHTVHGAARDWAAGPWRIE